MNDPILVTGASRRVGLQLALSLAEAGHDVLAVSRTPARSGHPRIRHLAADLQRKADRDRLIEQVNQEIGGLRGIIHNASLWLEDDLDNLDAMFRLHVEAPFHLNRALYPALRRVERADIIHVCDDTASRGSQHHIAYAATKTALLNMTLSFAERYAPWVRVNAVSPGLLILKEDSTPEYREQTLKKALLEFEPGAAPLIEAVLYLLGSSYSTGSNIVVNGGRHLRKRNA